MAYGPDVLSPRATPGRRVSSCSKDAFRSRAQTNRVLGGWRSGQESKCSQLSLSGGSDFLSEIDLINGRRIRIR